MRSLADNPDYAKTLRERWNHAFQAIGGQVAKSRNVPVIVGSQDFTFPLLVDEVLFSMILAGTLAIAGSIFLTLLVTLGDWALTLISTLIMAVVLSVTVCLKLFVSAPVMDLLDVFVLVALVGKHRTHRKRYVNIMF
jgi:ABC-type multidrug transport system fused ATPase/permease subunit